MTFDTPTTSVLYSIEHAIKEYRKFCQKNIAKVIAGITVDQALLLIILKQHPELNQKEIADMIFKDSASLTRITELLVKKGYLTRALHAKDRRKFKLEITEAGLETISSLSAIVHFNRENALAGLSEEEQKILYNILQKIISNCSKTR